MPVTITTQPTDSTATVGKTHSFTVAATGGTLAYQWFAGGSEIDGATSPTYDTLVATEGNSGARVFVRVTDTDDGTTVASDLVFAFSRPLAGDIPVSLLWNYNNNTFSWKDTSVEVQDGTAFTLNRSDYETYGFAPGFQQRWEDWKQGAYLESTWEADTTTLWSTTLSKTSDRDMLAIAAGQAYKNDKVRNRVGSLKKYYVERTQIDFDGLVGDFRSGKIKQTSRFIIDVQADQKQIARGSKSEVRFHIGWSLNLMDDPNYKAPVVFDLQSREFGGSYKVDYRSTGRYMGMYFDLTDSSQLSFTGGEVEVKQISGR